MYAYVTLKEGVTTDSDELMAELKKSVKDKIASYAVPEILQVKTIVLFTPQPFHPWCPDGRVAGKSLPGLYLRSRKV